MKKDITERGVYYDLSKSIYKFKYKELTFYFSSKFNLTRFIGKHLIYLRSENLKINSHFDCIFSMDYVILINLYKKIEKRGYKIKLNNDDLSKELMIACEVVLWKMI